MALGIFIIRSPYTLYSIYLRGNDTSIVQVESVQAERVDVSDIAAFLEGQGDLKSRLITPLTHIVTLIIHIIHLLTVSP